MTDSGREKLILTISWRKGGWRRHRACPRVKRAQAVHLGNGKQVSDHGIVDKPILTMSRRTGGWRCYRACPRVERPRAVRLDYGQVG